MACVSVELFRRQAFLLNAVHACLYSKLKVTETEQIPACQLSCVHIPILCPQLQGKICQHKPPAKDGATGSWHMGVCTCPLTQGKLPLLLSVSKVAQLFNQSEYERLYTGLRLSFTTTRLNIYRNSFLLSLLSSSSCQPRSQSSREC